MTAALAIPLEPRTTSLLRPLTEDELATIEGGVLPWVGAAGVILGASAFALLAGVAIGAAVYVYTH